MNLPPPPPPPTLGNAACPMGMHVLDLLNYIPKFVHWLVFSPSCFDIYFVAAVYVSRRLAPLVHGSRPCPSPTVPTLGVRQTSVYVGKTRSSFKVAFNRLVLSVCMSFYSSSTPSRVNRDIPVSFYHLTRNTPASIYRHELPHRRAPKKKIRKRATHPASQRPTQAFVLRHSREW